jgi:hypothetical protein
MGCMNSGTRSQADRRLSLRSGRPSPVGLEWTRGAADSSHSGYVGSGSLDKTQPYSDIGFACRDSRNGVFGIRRETRKETAANRPAIAYTIEKLQPR